MIKYSLNTFTLHSEDVEKALSIKCKCGHSVSGHGSPLMCASTTDNYDYWIPVSQCCFCTSWSSKKLPVCAKFEISNILDIE